MVSVKLAFFDDWAHDAWRELREGGVILPVPLSSEEVGLQYFNFHAKTILPVPRRFTLSHGFTCPKEHEPGVAELRSRVELGRSLVPHLRKPHREPSSVDYLHADWGIHHFHLGVPASGQFFVPRTGPLLFALVTETDFYALDVRQHGHWTDQDLLEMVHNQWPAALEAFRLNDMSGQTLTASERSRIRRKHSNALATMRDGTTYASPTGGVTSRGTYLNATIQLDRLVYELAELEQRAAELLPAFIRNLDQVLAPEETLRFSLRRAPGGSRVAFEPTHGLTLWLGSAQTTHCT